MKKTFAVVACFVLLLLFLSWGSRGARLSVVSDLVAGNVSEKALPIAFEWLIEPSYYRANDFSDGVAWVQEQEGADWKLITMQGEVRVAGFHADRVGVVDPDSGLAIFTDRNGMNGAVNQLGERVVAPHYTFLERFEKGASAAGVISDGALSYGVINKRGRILLPFKYGQPVSVLASKRYSVSSGDRWGVVDPRGRTLIPFEYAAPLQRLSSDVLLAPIQAGDPILDSEGRLQSGKRQVALLDAEGNQVIRGIYQSASLGDGIFSLEKNERIVFADASEVYKMPQEFYANTLSVSNGSFFSEGLASVYLKPLVRTLDGILPKEAHSAVINRKGEVIFEYHGYPKGAFKGGFLITVVDVKNNQEIYEIRDRSGKIYPLPPGLIPDEGGQEALALGILRVRQGDSSRENSEMVKIGFLKLLSE